MGHHNPLEDLITLNQIAAALHQTTDVRSALETALRQLVNLMGLETGWIFLKDETKKSRFAGPGYDLIAHYSLPPAIELRQHEVWTGNCNCQNLCNTGQMSEAYHEVKCSRLAGSKGDKRSLQVHASVPLQAGQHIHGILNVAAPEWRAFTTRKLSLLTHVGALMGVAIDRARLYDLLHERRLQEQAALLSLSEYLLDRPQLKEVIDFLLVQVQRLLDIDACALLLPNEATGRLDFRAAKGWKSDPLRYRRSLALDERSGPSMVMKTQEPLVIEDIDLQDLAPWMSDWIKAEAFRGHAVVPLIAEGDSIGALVVDSRKPRRWSDEEIQLLQLLANQAALALERARLFQVDDARQALEDELSVSQGIQRSMLPRSLPDVSGWQFAAVSKPAKQVGGDFYDFITLTNTGAYNLGIVIADVADKGVPAALYMALSRTIIRSVTMSGRTPAAALLRANEIMLNDSQADIFLTAFYASLDTQIGELSFCNAGHNPPLWYRADYHEIEPLTTKGIVLGILENITLHEQTVYIARDDVLVFYTDGVTEATNPGGEEFGLERLRGVVLGCCAAPAQVILDEIVDAVEGFMAGAPPFDDFTLVVIKREA